MIDVQLAHDLVGHQVVVKLIDRDDPKSRFVQDEYLGKTYVGEVALVRPCLRKSDHPMADRHGRMKPIIEHFVHLRESEEQTYLLRTWIIATLEPTSA